MSFLVAWRLFALVAVGALAGGWVASIYRRRRDVVRFTNVALLEVVAPQRPGWRRHLPAVLWLCAATFLIVGWARPVRDVRMAKERATVVIALDVSLSMRAEDVEPSRIDVASAAAIDFVDSLPDQVDVGLVAFSGSLSVVPPTADREEVRAALHDPTLSEYTAIGDAIIEGLELVAAAPAGDDGNPPPGRVVVLSDGETTFGASNEEASDAAAEADVVVDTIAFGTEDGVITEDGIDEPVPVAPGPLQDIADATGGTFYEADSLDALTEAYEEVNTVVGYETEEREISAWFVGAGLLALGVAGGLSLLWSQRLP